MANRFYDRLFEKAPGILPLFPSDMAEQRRKLLDMLDTLVYDLSDTNTVILELSELGRRHAGYDTQPEHYPVVAETLLETLQAELGDQFTANHERAWNEALEIVATVMIDAQRAVAV